MLNNMRLPKFRNLLIKWRSFCPSLEKTKVFFQAGHKDFIINHLNILKAILPIKRNWSLEYSETVQIFSHIKFSEDSVLLSWLRSLWLLQSKLPTSTVHLVRERCIIAKDCNVCIWCMVMTQFFEKCHSFRSWAKLHEWEEIHHVANRSSQVIGIVNWNTLLSNRH